MRKIITTIALAFLLAFSTISTSYAADVYLMRGLFGFAWQKDIKGNLRGVYKMQADLEKMGHKVHFYCWQPRCEKQIIDEIRKHPNRPFAIGGHSKGGDATTEIGRELNKYGIKIPYAFIIDAPIPVPLTPNFRKVDNFYQFNDWRNPILKPQSKSTILTQFNYRGKLGHIALADDLKLQKRIYQQINALGK